MAASLKLGVLLQNCSNCLPTTLLKLSSNSQKLFFQLTLSRGRRRTTKSPGWWLPQKTKFVEENLTSSNKAFIKEVIEDQSNLICSPLKEAPWSKGEWSPKSTRTGVIARKIGIIPQWTITGKKFYVTLLQVQDNHVIKWTTPETYATTLQGKKFGKGRFGSLVVGSNSADPQKFTGAYLSLFRESGVMPKMKMSRFLVTSDAAIQPGTPLYASHFNVGAYVDCQGFTVEHGFQGVVRRWGMKGGPASHGCTKTHRRLGATGGGGNMARIWPGKKMPGHMGRERRTLRGLRIWRINTKYNVLYIHGHTVPGSINNYVYIFDTLIPQKRIIQAPPPFPTYYPDEKNPLPEELFDPELFQFSQSTIEFPIDPKEKKEVEKTKARPVQRMKKKA